MATTVHIPVLLSEVIDGLSISPTDVVVDGTAGGGGYASRITETLSAKGMYIGIDLDSLALARTEAKIGKTKAKTALVLDNYRNLAAIAQSLGVTAIDKFVVDLGLSSDQLETSGRGFSFQREEPLGMTFTHLPGSDAVTAYDAINGWEEENLADVIYGFGEDPFSRRIAKRIVLARSERPIETSWELAELVKDAYPARLRNGKTHPATRTFQAIRMAVNDEMGSLQEGLQGAKGLLREKGRIAVVSFESVTDRMVKQTFQEWAREGEMEIITKRPIIASEAETKQNPRARSAKLRIIAKK